MSKRPDETDVPELEEGSTTAERRRRRRRGAGLRVPSDNVPRRSSPQPVVAPVPEDPNLAVSIAYSFSGEGEAAASGVPRTSAALAAAAATAEQLGDVVADGRTREMPAVQLEELGLEVPEDLTEKEIAVREPSSETMVVDVEEMKVRDGEGEGEPEAPEIEAEPEPEPEPEPDRPKRGRASTVALSDDDLEELVEPEVRAAMQQRAAAAPSGSNGQHDIHAPAPPPPDSALEAFDDHSSPALPTLAKKRVSTDSWDIDVEAPETRAPSEPPVATRRPESADEDIALDDADLQDEVVQPADAGDSGEILSDELIEEVEAQTAQAVPLRERPGTVPPVDEDEVEIEEAPPTRVDVAVQEKSAAPAAAREPTAPPAPAAAREPTAPPAREPTAPPAPPAEKAEKHADKPEKHEKHEKPEKPEKPEKHDKAAAQPGVVHKPPPAPPPSAKKPTAARVAAVAAAVAPADARLAEGKEDKKRRAKPWFEEIFDEDYLRTLPFLTPQATQGEAQFVIEALGLQPGAQVLDLGCGYGRHAMELAARGFHVVGLDLSLPLLLRGADEAQRRGLTINFVHGDMRELDFDSQFDGAYCVFSTFGYFDDETNKKTATNLARALKPGAKVVIDILNRDYLIADLPTRVWWEGDGCVVLEEVEFNYFSSRVQTNRSVVFDDGRQVEQEISMRAYSLHEIGKLLHAAGFRVLEISGSMATRGRFFGGTSRQIIVVAERRPKDSAGTTPSGA